MASERDHRPERVADGAAIDADQTDHTFGHLHPNPTIARMMAQRLQQRRKAARAAQPNSEPKAETHEVTTDPAPQHHHADQLSVDEALARLLGARATLQADPHNLQEARQLADPVGPWMRRLTSTENVGRHFGGRPGFDAALQSLGFAEEALIGLIQRLHIGAAALPDRRWEHDLSQIAAMRELLRVLAGELPVEKSALAGALDSATRAGVHLAHGTAMVALGPLALAASAELAVAGGTKILTLALTNPILTNELGLFAAGAALQIASAGGLVEHLRQLRSPLGAVQILHDAITIYLIVRSNTGPVMIALETETVDETGMIRAQIRGGSKAMEPQAAPSGVTQAKSWETAREGEVLDQKTGFSLKDINPGYPTAGRTMNCANCAIATDATLSGAPACALPGNDTSTVEITNSLGKNFDKDWFAAPDPDGVARVLKRWGPGSRAVLFGYRGPKISGHYFNVVNEEGKVRFYDGQSGRVDFAGFVKLYILRTEGQ